MYMGKELVKKKIKKTVLGIDPTAKVILFGSRARGTEHKESDWDILVLVDKPVVTFKDQQVFRNKLYDVELEAEEIISTFVCALDDWNGRQSVTPLHNNILREGIYL